jgi:hypothetical protein
MTPQQAVGLAARLFAIWLALGSFQSWAVARALRSQGVMEATWVQWSVPALYWVGAVVLWFFPMSIAHRLVPRTKFEDRLALPAQQAVVVACIVLGLAVVLVRALPALSAYVSLAAVWIASGASLSSMDGTRHIELFSGLIQLLVGLAFVFKAGAIAARILPAAPTAESLFPATSIVADTRL